MKNRFGRIGKTLLGAVCLLSTCGVTYSCSDDFDLDETRPSFLGASIYDELKNRTDRKFSTVIRLVDDLDYQDVLSKTGSKTLFVADDDAFAEFFATTTWTDGNGQPVRSYDQLSTSQKRLLLNGSMLNNAYVLEMMTTIQGPVKNLCLRQLSSIAATDSLPYFKWDELPNNQNVVVSLPEGTNRTFDKRFWDKYRTQARGGIYMALDKTEPMLTHFLQAQMEEQNIEPSDISFILGLDGTDDAWNDSRNRSFVYNREIIEPDVTCLNGYYDVLNGVLVTPPNMAEMIRQNADMSLPASERTRYFSQMLDRFSAPYYDATLTEEYKALHSIAADSVFQKLYISLRNQTGSGISTDPDGEPLGDYPVLPYDPGWNAYSVNNSTKEQDMAAMFAPSDEAIEKFFLYGGGSVLIQNYADQTNELANLEHNLYQIPLDVVQALVANLMKESFNETVPSKYRTIMNSAQDQMFTASDYPTVEAYKDSIQKVMLANNGVVYVMKNVISPPEYAAVSSPVLTDESAQVMRAVIQADARYTASNGTYAFYNAPLQKFYNTYLMAMQANFSLFIPTDEGLRNYGYLDPVSFGAGAVNARYWTFVPGTLGDEARAVAVTATPYDYYSDADFNPTNPSSSVPVNNARESVASGWGLLKKLMLCDMTDQHILVHSDDEEEGLVNATKQYYVSRSGAPIFIKQGDKNGTGVDMVVNGGFQLLVNNDQNPANDFDCKVTKGYNFSEGYGNGHTYFLDRPMQPTYKTVSEVLNENYNDFLDICSEFAGGNTDLMEKIFRTDDMDNSEWAQEQLRYRMFSVNSVDQSSGGRPTAQNAVGLIRFFNNYRYTIFVPTSDALLRAVNENHLPTIAQIIAFTEDPDNLDETGKLTDTARAQAQAMVTCLMNFLKYHFCDESYFVDQYDDSDFTESQSASSEDNGVFIRVGVKHQKNGLIVRDQLGRELSVQGVYNQMARDYELDTDQRTNARNIRSSSYVVLHEINDFMTFSSDLVDERGNIDFRKAWEQVAGEENPEVDAAVAKAFVKKYRLKK